MAGRRIRQYWRPGRLDGNLLPRWWNANANTNCNRDRHSYCDANSNSNSNNNSHGDCHSDGNSHSHAHSDTDTDAVRRKVYSDAAASSNSSASPIAPVAASLCEAETWDDCKRG